MAKHITYRLGARQREVMRRRLQRRHEQVVAYLSVSIPVLLACGALWSATAASSMPRRPCLPARCAAIRTVREQRHCRQHRRRQYADHRPGQQQGRPQLGQLQCRRGQRGAFQSAGAPMPPH